VVWCPFVVHAWSSLRVFVGPLCPIPVHMSS